MERRLEKRSRNEALLREINERIADVDRSAEASALVEGTELYEFFCECGASNGEELGCDEHVSMTLAEYDQVRSQDDRFALYPGHESELVEWVASRTERFVIVDKRSEAEPFVVDDPRGEPSE